MSGMTKKHCFIYGFLFFLFLIPAMASAEIVDRIVAVVNDDIITLSELKSAIRPYEDKLAASGYSQDKMETMLFNLKQEMLKNLVDRKITDQEVKKLGFTVSDQEVDRAIEQLKRSRMMTQEDLEKALKQEGMTFESYREKIRQEILRPKLINFSVKSKVIVTDKDIKSYYDAHPEMYGGTKKVYLRNIMITAGALDVDGFVQQKMNEISRALLDGKSFGEVARRYSQAPNAGDGGRIGLFSLDTLSGEIADAVKDLAAGEHTAFIQTDLGYQMFFVEKIEEGSGKPLKAVSDEISKKLYDQIVEKKFNTWIEGLRDKAHVKKML